MQNLGHREKRKEWVFLGGEGTNERQDSSFPCLSSPDSALPTEVHRDHYGLGHKATCMPS